MIYLPDRRMSPVLMQTLLHFQGIKLNPAVNELVTVLCRYVILLGGFSLESE